MNLLALGVSRAPRTFAAGLTGVALSLALIPRLSSGLQKKG
jgi:hypothetical protein